MANETFPLSKPIKNVNPAANLDFDYGPYVSVEAALAALAEIGKVGRPFAVFKDETKKTVDFFLIGEDADGNKIAVPTEGGGAKFPEAGADGDILEKDGTTAEGAKWSNRLTTAESEIDAEVVNRAAEDLAEKNVRIAADNAEALARANADALKQDKSLFSALVDKWVHYYDATTQKFQPILKFVSGVISLLEFIGNIKANAFILPRNSDAAIANRLRSDGSRLYYANDLAVESILEASKTVTSTYNPPTLAQIATLGLAKGDTYVCSTTSQRTRFDGVQLEKWKYTPTEWASATADQKAAVNLNFISA